MTSWDPPLLAWTPYWPETQQRLGVALAMVVGTSYQCLGPDPSPVCFLQILHGYSPPIPVPNHPSWILYSTDNFIGFGVSFKRIKKVLEVDSGNDCQTK